jgi:hypothetical protein
MKPNSKLNLIPKKILDPMEELEKVEKANEADIANTQRKKEKYALEMKGMLGQKMKENPRQVTVVKKTRTQKILNVIKRLFTKL